MPQPTRLDAHLRDRFPAEWHFKVLLTHVMIWHNMHAITCVLMNLQITFLYTTCMNWACTAHLYTYTHTHMRTHTHIHIYTYTYTYIHIYTYTHIHIYTYTHIHIHTHTQTHRNTQTRIHLLHTRTSEALAHAHAHTFTRTKYSGGCRCALVGVPWRGSVSACLAWGDIVSFNMLSKVLKMLSTLRRQGTSMRAHLQLPER